LKCTFQSREACWKKTLHAIAAKRRQRRCSKPLEQLYHAALTITWQQAEQPTRGRCARQQAKAIPGDMRRLKRKRKSEQKQQNAL